MGPINQALDLWGSLIDSESYFPPEINIRNKSDPSENLKALS